MPRQRTKTRPYTLRFPRELEASIDSAANLAGQEPRQWLEKTFESALRRKFKIGGN